jgi:hypothetical protein
MSEGDVYFLLEVSNGHFGEASLVEERFLDDEGSVPPEHEDKIIYVDQNWILARQDGVFVKEEKINGAAYYRQCLAPELP